MPGLMLLLIASALATPAAPLLGVASDYNVFAFGNLNQSGGDAEGRVAVGNNATISGMAVNTKSPGALAWGMVVGGHITAADGQLYGSLAYGEGAYLDGSFTIVGGSAAHASPIDFLAARNELRSTSAYLRSLFDSYAGQVTYLEWGGVSLSGSRPELNVFFLDGLKVQNTLTIDAPASATVVVNVSGTTQSWSGFSMQSTVPRSQVLFNFYESALLDFGALSFQGTVLAPDASLFLSSGNIQGNVIVDNVTASSRSGEFHDYAFRGSLPEAPAAIPEPATWGGVCGCLIALAVFRRRRA